MRTTVITPALNIKKISGARLDNKNNIRISQKLPETNSCEEKNCIPCKDLKNKISFAYYYAQTKDTSKSLSFKGVGVSQSDNLTSKSPSLHILRKDSISSLKKADVVVFITHPDDEVFFLPILKYANEGKTIQFIYCTSGENGCHRNDAPTAQEELKKWRENELLCSLDSLGINKSPVELDFADLNLYKHSDEINTLFDRILEQCQPEIVLSFGPDGITGHPDHKQTGKCAFDAVKKYNELSNSDTKLYNPVFSDRSCQNLSELAKNARTDAFDFISPSPYAKNAKIVDVSQYEEQIRNSLLCHNSQWKESEVNAITNFYTTNPVELISLEEFPDVDTQTSPWKLRNESKQINNSGAISPNNLSSN